MVNKKALSLAVMLALTATSVWAADTTTGDSTVTDSKLTKYQ